MIPRYAACRVLRRRGVPVRACVALGMMARRRHQSCARPSFFCLCACAVISPVHGPVSFASAPARACMRWRGRASARSTRHAHPAQRLRMHICACWRCADAICLCVCADLVRVLPFMLFDMHISTSTACADPRSEPGCALTPPAPCPLPPSMTIASDVDAEGAMEESSRVCVHVHGGVCNCACAAHASDTCACRRGKALSRAELLRTPAWRRASMPPVSARVLQCD